MNVLIVDDDRFDRIMVRRALSSIPDKVEATEVDSVGAAIEKMDVVHYEVILLDYNLPGRAGLDLLVHMNASEIKHAGVVIMMSNSEDEQLALDCIHAGAHDFLLKKDISLARLRSAILHAQKRRELEGELRESFQKVKHLAERDRLTGLANRYLFEESLGVAIANHRRKSGIIAVLLFDVDEFKLVNDSYGHSAGDELLVRLARRVCSSLRGNELFARLGGDEFVLALTDIQSVDDAVRVASRIHRALEFPFEIDGHDVKAGVSVGIAASDEQMQVSVEEFMKRADIAMYRSKQEGKHRTSVFESSLQEKLNRRLALENGLRKALGLQQFSLFYQPVVRLADNAVVGYEALVRWQLKGEAVGPDEFIPIAEESGSILAIGRWVIAEAVRQLGQWQRHGQSRAYMAINLSAVQVRDDKLLEYISDCCRDAGVAATDLVFELTETALLRGSDKAALFFEQLCALGCRLALDDFGTGYSSVSHLIDFPIRQLKIDRSVVVAAQHRPEAGRLLEGLCSMALAMGLTTVVEGIEEPDMERMARQAGALLVQGYLYGKPQPAAYYNQQKQ